MSGFWSAFIIVFTVLNIAACIWLMSWSAKHRKGEDATTGHTWDGDLAEYNNPLPRWWLILFYLTIIFSAIYLVLYPGLGKFEGLLGWNQAEAYDAEMAHADAAYGDIFSEFAGMTVEALADDERAMGIAHNLFANHCAQCHGSDGRGVPGFPNLADEDWLYGGDPETVKYSILEGRNGIMPALGDALGKQGVEDTVAYVLSLSGQEFPAEMVSSGEQKFSTFCAACHGPGGIGNQTVGAPNLTDDVWLYGSSVSAIREGILHGRNNQMPGHRTILGEDRVHLLTAYVLNLAGMSGEAGELTSAAR